MHRRIKIFISLLLSLFCSGILEAASCCTPANQKIHDAVRRAAAQNLDSFEVNLGRVDAKMRPVRPSSAKQTDPLVIVVQNGFNSLGTDSDPADECWDLLWTYVAGDYVYYGVVVANYEDFDVPIQLKFKVEGAKNITLKRSKTISSLTIAAYFVRLKLAQRVATYLLTTTLFWRQGALPFVLLDQLQTYSIVNDVQL